jgi:uncharacterized membrane protein YqjE
MLEKKIEQQARLFSVELDKKKQELISVLFFISTVEMLLLIHDCRNSLQHHPAMVKSWR